MLKVAESRGLYTDLVRADLNAEVSGDTETREEAGETRGDRGGPADAEEAAAALGLPSSWSERFSCLLCIGTTTYLDPHKATAEWLRLLKPGGLAVFTHKTAVWKKWEPVQGSLVAQGAWAEVSVSDELPYLPGFDDNARDNERAKVYVYMKEGCVQ
jgi:hypothetical protein